MRKFILTLLILPLIGFSEEAKSLKAVFDCSTGDTDWISLRLSLIKKTAESLIREDKNYNFIITIHSHCIHVVDRNLKKYPSKKAEKIKFIQSQLQTLKELYGVKIKACEIAMKRGKVSSIPAYVTPVPNSWITLIELQNSGFAFIPF